MCLDRTYPAFFLAINKTTRSDPPAKACKSHAHTGGKARVSPNNINNKDHTARSSNAAESSPEAHLSASPSTDDTKAQYDTIHHTQWVLSTALYPHQRKTRAPAQANILEMPQCRRSYSLTHGTASFFLAPVPTRPQHTPFRPHWAENKRALLQNVHHLPPHGLYSGASLISGGSSNVWIGGGEGSTHSSEKAPTDTS
eukprot:TRINITY_DN997_c0_g1_i1.p1 TRINITY_DN997_c0_g1~~TRINITY_DN997_c0_g1_i1.p1  ORF type:complete len:198 (+),score=8.47 TRINITY_DN997_c0_g1_i1:48-641(+)